MLLRTNYDRYQELFSGSLEALIKDELSGFNKKSKFMGFSKDRKLAQLSHVEVLKKKLVENKAEVLVCIGRAQTTLRDDRGCA